MQVLRTPETCFADLADYSFDPHYLTIRDPDGTELRMHYVDEGPRDGTPILLLHGEPSWSYLYRAIIPDLAARGFRAVAPDLVGFGKSDKPAAREDYTYERHVAWLTNWFQSIALPPVTLFCQDWGGLLGLRLVAAVPEKFAAVLAGNTDLPVGQGMSEGFLRWREYSQSVPVMNVGGIVKGGVKRKLSAAEITAYNAPFPDETFKAGARQFPTLVPVEQHQPSVAENLAAWKSLEAFSRPFVTAFSDGDPVTAGCERQFQARVPGARGRAHRTLSGGHFLQEDSPAEIAALLEEVARTGAPLV
jgi:haloalkane dehalogenase